MQYLNYEKLEAIDPKAFQQTHPYPWMNPAGLLTDEGYKRLIDTLPPVEICTPIIGKQRSHGQKPHDRYALEYSEDTPVSADWHAFIDELKGERYKNFIQNMFGRGRFQFNFHWHYAPAGGSVSPHCDAVRKLGSHIFYLNTPENWNPDWGGDTLILDDNGRFDRKSAPDFEDFDQAWSGTSMGNTSLLFQRQERSWHGVREITCPPGKYRKVFIVVINDRLRAMLKRTVSKLKGEGARDY